jgi:hypothetical protein
MEELEDADDQLAVAVDVRTDLEHGNPPLAAGEGHQHDVGLDHRAPGEAPVPQAGADRSENGNVS